jgi:hypothetical protein
VTNDVVNTVFTRNESGFVGAAIVDDEPFNDIEPRDSAR